jgi:hypothetical protein
MDDVVEPVDRVAAHEGLASTCWCGRRANARPADARSRTEPWITRWRANAQREAWSIVQPRSMASDCYDKVDEGDAK